MENTNIFKHGKLIQICFQNWNRSILQNLVMNIFNRILRGKNSKYFIR